eukprot:2717493-Heterocapsa_arctica.AAC.1
MARSGSVRAGPCTRGAQGLRAPGAQGRRAAFSLRSTRRRYSANRTHLSSWSVSTGVPGRAPQCWSCATTSSRVVKGLKKDHPTKGFSWTTPSSWYKRGGGGAREGN